MATKSGEEVMQLIPVWVKENAAFIMWLDWFRCVAKLPFQAQLQEDKILSN